MVNYFALLKKALGNISTMKVNIDVYTKDLDAGLAAFKKAVEEDKMLFQDEIFQIEPLEGKIWPNTEMTCCVTFRPHGPYHYSCTAFCNVTCA